MKNWFLIFFCYSAYPLINIHGKFSRLDMEAMIQSGEIIDKVLTPTAVWWQGWSMVSHGFYFNANLTENGHHKKVTVKLIDRNEGNGFSAAKRHHDTLKALNANHDPHVSQYGIVPLIRYFNLTNYELFVMPEMESMITNIELLENENHLAKAIMTFARASKYATSRGVCLGMGLAQAEILYDKNGHYYFADFHGDVAIKEHKLDSLTYPRRDWEYFFDFLTNNHLELFEDQKITFHSNDLKNGNVDDFASKMQTFAQTAHRCVNMLCTRHFIGSETRKVFHFIADEAYEGWFHKKTLEERVFPEYDKLHDMAARIIGESNDFDIRTIKIHKDDILKHF